MASKSGILTAARNTLKSASLMGSSVAFPSNIQENDRALIIKVYDTKNSDLVNAGLEGAATKVITGLKTAFDQVGSGAVPPSGGISAGNKKLKKDFKDYLILPFPNSISEEMSHSYDEEESWIKDTAFTQVPAEMAKGFVGKTPAAVAKLTGSQAYKYYENKIAMYQSTTARQISLSWTLVPYNPKEAENLHEIVRKLKMYSSPELLAGKLILRSPHFFELNFQNTIVDKALQFKEVNITAVQIEYSAGGNMELFHDGMPKSIDLSITFADREPKTHEDWDDKPLLEEVGDNC